MDAVVLMNSAVAIAADEGNAIANGDACEGKRMNRGKWMKLWFPQRCEKIGLMFHVDKDLKLENFSNLGEK